MQAYSLNTVAVVLLVLGLVVPTGAVLADPDGEDLVLEEVGIVLVPHDGPNGAYAELGPAGNLSIDLETVGINADALTSIRGVFDVVNAGEETVAIWITHDATYAVEFVVGEDRSIQGEGRKLELAPDERVAVDLRIDTHGVDPSGDPLLQRFSMHAAPVAPSTTTSSAGGGGGQQPSTGEPTNETPTPTPVPGGADEGVEVIFDRPVDGRVTVRPVGVEEIERLGGEDDRRPPRAVVRHAHGDEPLFDSECPCGDDPRLRTLGVDAVVETGQALSLSGSGTLVGSMRSIDRERDLVRAVDITVPDGHESTGATVRMRVNADRFAGPSNPRIARKTDGGWQMLPTRVVGRDGGQLVLETKTPGFSVFAVFATADVTFRWEADGETVTADEIRRGWETPGIRNVTLTVTDALGRTDTVTYRVLVNDPPAVTIDAPTSIPAGEPTTLRANVTNEVGDASVQWLFSDGTRRTGLEVEHVFEAGERTVRVEVEDEFGSTGSVERTLDVGPAGARQPLVDRIAGDVPTAARLAVVALLAGLLVLLLRRLVGGRPAARLRGVGRLATLAATPLRNRAPRIVAVDSPSVDTRNGRFVIGFLRVDDPDGNLETVEIRVLDRRGTEVARKSIDLRGRAEYAVRDAVVPPKSRVYIRADEAYTVEVRARDAADRWTQHSARPFHAGAGATGG